jgi:hypothetical protein
LSSTLDVGALKKLRLFMCVAVDLTERQFCLAKLIRNVIRSDRQLAARMVMTTNGLLRAYFRLSCLGGRSQTRVMLAKQGVLHRRNCIASPSPFSPDWYVGGSVFEAGMLYFNRGDRALPASEVYRRYESGGRMVWGLSLPGLRWTNC